MGCVVFDVCVYVCVSIVVVVVSIVWGYSLESLEERRRIRDVIDAGGMVQRAYRR